MSGLNAIEMSSLPRARRTCGYRRAERGPDRNGSEGARPAQGYGPSVARTENPGGGGEAGRLVGSPGAADSAQAGEGRRWHPGAWLARQALEPGVRTRVSPEGADSLSEALLGLRSYVCQREVGRVGPDRQSRHA